MKHGAILASVVGATLALVPEPALGWANGIDGPNSYGGHDWVLDRGVGAAGERCRWVELDVALRATDDPDTKDGIDHASGPWWHVWDEWGHTYGNAPEAAEVWFDKAVARLASGNRRSASYALGILSHFVADVAQPMHTDGYLEAEDRVHSEYEKDVDKRIAADPTGYGVRFDGVDPVDPHTRTLHMARYSHRYYRELVTKYDQSGYTTRVHDITGRRLNRAANAVADICASIRNRA